MRQRCLKRAGSSLSNTSPNIKEAHKKATKGNKPAKDKVEFLRPQDLKSTQSAPVSSSKGDVALLDSL